MKVTSVTVHAGRTFSHPHEDYSNLKPEVFLTATLDEGEDHARVVKALQAEAEGLVEDHKQGLLRSIEELHELSRRQAEMKGLESELRRAQDRLDLIRKQHPELARIGNGDDQSLLTSAATPAGDDEVPL